MRRTIVLLATMSLTLLVASGVAWAVTKIGTDGPDTLRGTNGDDKLVGLGGNDKLYALRGDDNLRGGPGKDVVLGGTPSAARSGNKNLLGGRGNDIDFGGNGSNNVVGGAGNDFMVDGEVEHDQSLDIVSGGAGKDVIVAANSPAFEDIVTCGDSFDRVLADRKDVVAPDCERVDIGLASFEEFFNSIPQSFFEGLPQFPVPG